MRTAAAILIVTACVAAAPGQQAEERSFEPISEGGGVKVYLKMDFDSGKSPFVNEAKGEASLATDAACVVSGRSLHVRRAQPGGYFGARTNRVAVQGSRGLNIAFCVRSRGMRKVSLNFFDDKADDNTTPASPARVLEDTWRTVVYAVEDFHHNSKPPQRKVPANTRHTSLFFHGPEQKGEQGEYWIDKFVIYRGVDTQAPEAPKGLKAAESGGKVSLTWEEPADNVFPAVYSVYRKPAKGGWEKVGETIPPRYEDVPPAAGQFAYRVTAADYDNNCSGPADAVAVKVDKPAKVDRPKPTPQETDRMAYADNVRAIHARGEGKVRHDVFLFQGDSITAADAYGFVLCSWLGRGINVKRGTGMMKTGYGRGTIGKDLSNHNPEFAVIMWGTNNSKAETAIPPAMEDMAAIIDACAAHGTVPIVATIPPKRFDKAKQDGQERYNTALVKLCRDKKVPISYCFELMMQRDLRQMLGDGTHLKPTTGNDTAGEALYRTMQQVYFALRDTRGSWK